MNRWLEKLAPVIVILGAVNILLMGAAGAHQAFTAGDAGSRVGGAFLLVCAIGLIALLALASRIMYEEWQRSNKS